MPRKSHSWNPWKFLEAMDIYLTLYHNLHVLKALVLKWVARKMGAFKRIVAANHIKMVALRPKIVLSCTVQHNVKTVDRRYFISSG